MSDTITQLPPAPLPTDTTAQFNEKAFNLVAALDGFVEQTNILAASVEADASNAEAAATSATDNAVDALASKNAAEAAEETTLAYKTAAENAAAAAVGAYDEFDDRYLGSKSADPATDNDGNPLNVGALYWNTSNNIMKAWSGSAWEAAYVPAGGFLTDSDIGITVQEHDPDTAKTNVEQTYTAKQTFGSGILESKNEMSGNVIDISAGNYFTKTISTAATLTVSDVPAAGTVGAFVLDLTNGGAGTITWWSGIKWEGGTAPTLTASGRDVIGFFTHDGGTTWTGIVRKDFK